MTNWRGENKLVGIGPRIKRDLLLGLAIGIAFYGISKLIPALGTIGLPPGTQAIGDSLGKILLVVIVAPVVEELFFRGALLDILDTKLKLSFFVAALISSAFFSFYHFTAYGASLSAASGSFILAGFVGFGLCYVRKYADSNTPNIIIHAVLNFLILVTTLSLVTFG